MGLALPHVRSMQPKQFCMIFARSRDGVEYDSPDGKPVHIIFGMAAPSYDERMSNEYLQVYKWIARCFKEEDWLIPALLEAKDEHEIIGMLSGLDWAKIMQNCFGCMLRTCGRASPIPMAVVAFRSLDDSIRAYEKGVGNLRQCAELLSAAEEKVKVLLEKDGGFRLADLDSDGEDGGDGEDC